MDSLVSTDWLAARMTQEHGLKNLVILDASRHLPASGRDARQEFEQAHIAGARYLDLANLTDPTSDVPAALPNAEQLALRLDQLAIGADDRIILYDDSAVKTSARAWFALIAHGRTSVAILDGGLEKWRVEGGSMESGPGNNATLPATSASFASLFNNPRRVASKHNILDVIGDQRKDGAIGAAQILDARAADRVFGSGIDPVHGGQNGRIPGALNVPFGRVFNADGTFKDPAELRDLFIAAGVDLDRPIITSCGSGVTASVLVFALHLTGVDTAHLYDGSWQEWEADPTTPKEQGPQ
ncbi:MAG: sulfurtransferase [Erythrobacter sp.]